MEATSDPLLFLAMVAFISMSGALMPGPMFATAVHRGLKDGRAGLKMAVGHAIVEIPLIVAIFLGLETVLRDEAVFAAIGIVGGAFLLYMGASMFRAKLDEKGSQESKHGSVVAGIVLTAANPYFILWWATVGASLVMLASGFGLWIIPLFVVVHLACDFGWFFIISLTVNRSRTFWTGDRYRYLYGACGTVLIVFAAYFIYSSVAGLVG